MKSDTDSRSQFLASADRLFVWLRSSAFLYRFTLLTRILLAAAFLPTGMVKLMGRRFTLIGPEHPVGAFFEAMYQTGFFWNFIGLVQVVAAVLLLIPPLAHLGAAIFVPIIINIFVITLSLAFGNTAIITGLMVLAVTWLCVWDFDRFRSMLTTRPLNTVVPVGRLDVWEFIGFLVFAISLLAFFFMTRSLIDSRLGGACVIAGFAGGLLALARFRWFWWRQGFTPKLA
ncbi:MAG: hypothetical protein ACR2NP_05660 [Pirellulaceae bacterium]